MRLEKRILIVEDDPAIRALLLTVLRKRGWSVDVTCDGIAATDRLQNCSYALLIVDLMMPGRSGYDLLEKVSAIRKEVRPLVLVLTSGGTPRGLDTSTVVGLFHKPFDIDLLLNTVSGILAVDAADLQPDQPN